ncbi:MAG: L-type lectin-domain containing protein [Saprospiraceae bacterium]|nr:L-type lectin-domain containing protein [Saprospiraceae bacterium]
MKTLTVLVLCWWSTTGILAQDVFAINNFAANASNLNLLGASTFVGEALRLTPSQPGLQGAAWYQARQIELDKGFETEFTFLISGASKKPGDGFAFVMQDQSPEVIGGTGDNIGYKQIPDVMAIEFDTKDDGEGSINHVNLSFYDPDLGTYRRYATVHEIPEITDGKAHFTKIIYRDGKLEVYLDSYLFPVLSVRIDIAGRIGASNGRAWLGFTSSTSEDHAHHDLLQWSLKEFLPEPTAIATDEIEVVNTHTTSVSSRKLRVKVWDHNKIDGDVISLKWGDEWILTDYKLTAKPHEIMLTLHGFEQRLVLYANNVGLVPPNTAMLSIYDGTTLHRVKLNADFETSEAVVIRYGGSR